MERCIRRRGARPLALWVLGLFLTASTGAFAANGDIWIAPCENCNAMSDFGAAALREARAAVQTGLYVITSQNYPRTGYVRVTGSPGWVCDRFGECQYTLRNAYAQLIDETGTRVAVPTDLDRIDEALHGTSRAQRIPPLPIRPDYAGSIINSFDEEVIPAIAQALLVGGFNPGYLPLGTKVIVVFVDGTKAEFVKVCQCTDMWRWTGKAWNAEGRRITRDGTLVPNPNWFGNGGGRVITRFTDAGTPRDIRFLFTGERLCRVSTRVQVNGVEISYIATYLPC
jgi:hypothetical protein